MCKKRRGNLSEKKAQFGANQSRAGICAHNAFFSIDAAFALLIAIMAFISFSTLLSSAASSAKASADSSSSSLLALRLSSFIISESEEKGGFGTASYRKAGEIDVERAEGIDLSEFLSQGKRDYAGFSISDSSGGIAGNSFGSPGNETYCAKRLVIVSGKIALLEACVS